VIRHRAIQASSLPAADANAAKNRHGKKGHDPDQHSASRKRSLVSCQRSYTGTIDETLSNSHLGNMCFGFGLSPGGLPSWHVSLLQAGVPEEDKGSIWRITVANDTMRAPFVEFTCSRPRAALNFD
jgi:hypothetical protein